MGMLIQVILIVFFSVIVCMAQPSIADEDSAKTSQVSADEDSAQISQMPEVEKLTPIFVQTERHLKERPYFHGKELSLVDVNWLPLLHRANLIYKHSGYDFLEMYPKLKRWQEALMNTGLAEASVPKDFEEIFIGFYLNEGTYLGRLAQCRKN